MKVNLEDISKISKQIIEYCKRQKTKVAKTGAWVIGFTGNLGAGKTTFIQSLAIELGVKDSIQSPTFVIMKPYKTSDDLFKMLLHIDAYRINDQEELLPLKLNDYFSDPLTLVCIEWPELLEPLKELITIHVYIDHLSESERSFRVEEGGKDITTLFENI